MIDELQKKLEQMNRDYEDLAQTQKEVFDSVIGKVDNMEDGPEKKQLSSLISRIQDAQANNDTQLLHSMVNELKTIIKDAS